MSDTVLLSVNFLLGGAIIVLLAAWMMYKRERSAWIRTMVRDQTLASRIFGSYFKKPS